MLAFALLENERSYCVVSGRVGVCIVQCDPIRADEYCAKAQHLEPKSHSFLLELRHGAYQSPHCKPCSRRPCFTLAYCGYTGRLVGFFRPSFLERLDLSRRVPLMLQPRCNAKSDREETASTVRTFSTGGDGSVERKVRQVVLNLLSNAIKFTPEGGRIEIAAKPKDGLVEVSVPDTGVGIAPEDQEAVFEQFRH